MKAYLVKAVVEFFSGVIGLTPEQAKPRARNLRNVSGDVYEVACPIQFKAGEIIRLEDMPKPYEDRLEPFEIAGFEIEEAPVNAALEAKMVVPDVEVEEPPVDAGRKHKGRAK